MLSNKKSSTLFHQTSKIIYRWYGKIMQPTIQDLQANEASQVNLEVLCSSVSLLESKIGTTIKSVQFLKGTTTNIIRLQYRGFTVDFCVVETEAKREWLPNE